MKKRNFSIAIVCLVLFLFFVIFQINLSLFSRSYVRHSSTRSEGKFQVPKKSFKRDPLAPSPLESPEARQIKCDRSHHFYDLCRINGPTVFDPTASTFYSVDPTKSTTPPSYTLEKIRPYPRKWENNTMTRIGELTLTSGPPSPPCEAQHNAPALVFSAGGYTGNFFHEFNDGFIPLFITVNSMFPNNQDFILVILKARDWWVSKYAELLQTFSKHPIINLDSDRSTHCFTSATLGLISHGYMTINPTLIPNSKTFTHFHAQLDEAYGHAQNPPFEFNSPKLRPRLVLVSRTSGVGRVILNQNQVKNVARNVGFDVVIFEPTPNTPLREAYALINSSHAMVGVHGAALTHLLFLRPGSVFGQVVPLGTDWVAEVCFGNSARAMGLEYMEYKIGVEESSLIDKYDKNSLLIKDPVAFQGKNWSSAIMDIYLKEQNVRLDLFRFKKYLKKAYKKAKQFMDRKG